MRPAQKRSRPAPEDSPSRLFSRCNLDNNSSSSTISIGSGGSPTKLGNGSFKSQRAAEISSTASSPWTDSNIDDDSFRRRHASGDGCDTSTWQARRAWSTHHREENTVLEESTGPAEASASQKAQTPQEWRALPSISQPYPEVLAPRPPVQGYGCEIASQSPLSQLPSSPQLVNDGGGSSASGAATTSVGQALGLASLAGRRRAAGMMGLAALSSRR